MGRPMKLLPVLGILFSTGSFAAGCTPGRDVKSAEKEDKLAFDEAGKGKKCDKPKSNCEEVKDEPRLQGEVPRGGLPHQTVRLREHVQRQHQW